MDEIYVTYVDDEHVDNHDYDDNADDDHDNNNDISMIYWWYSYVIRCFRDVLGMLKVFSAEKNIKKISKMAYFELL